MAAQQAEAGQHEADEGDAGRLRHAGLRDAVAREDQDVGAVAVGARVAVGAGLLERGRLEARRAYLVGVEADAVGVADGGGHGLVDTVIAAGRAFVPVVGPAMRAEPGIARVDQAVELVEVTSTQR